MSGPASHPPQPPESLGDRVSKRGASPPAGPGDSTAALPSAELSPAHIGPYRLLEKIGEGGMGMVFVAEQLRPIHRRVAIKLIKLGMDSQEVIARFESERQALAMMDHPNIAQVFDAGVTRERPPLLRDGACLGAAHHGVLRSQPAHDESAARAVHPGLPSDPARASEGDHSPRPEAVEHPGDGATTASRCRR